MKFLENRQKRRHSRGKARQPRPWTERSEGSGLALARRKGSRSGDFRSFRTAPYHAKLAIIIPITVSETV